MQQTPREAEYRARLDADPAITSGLVRSPVAVGIIAALTVLLQRLDYVISVSTRWAALWPAYTRLLDAIVSRDNKNIGCSVARPSTDPNLEI